MKKLTQHEFVAKAMSVHGDKYGYDKAKFDGVRSRVIITCPSHGDFEQKAGSHLRGRGCVMCAETRGRYNVRKGNDKFIDEARKVHGCRYGYSRAEYQTNKTKVDIECHIHGFFSQSPKCHLLGQGCPTCGVSRRAHGRTTGKSKFIEKSKLIHGNKYSYEYVVYFHGKAHVRIGCKKHGTFMQAPTEHLQGSGCPKCASFLNSFKVDSWIKKARGRDGIFYIIKCTGNGEVFYKYGITFRSLKLRYESKKSMPYEYEVVREVCSSDLNYIWMLEERVASFKKRNRYKPKLKFAGSLKECFTTFTGKTELTKKDKKCPLH